MTKEAIDRMLEERTVNEKRELVRKIKARRVARAKKKDRHETILANCLVYFIYVAYIMLILVLEKPLLINLHGRDLISFIMLSPFFNGVICYLLTKGTVWTICTLHEIKHRKRNK